MSRSQASDATARAAPGTIPLTFVPHKLLSHEQIARLTGPPPGVEIGARTGFWATKVAHYADLVVGRPPPSAGILPEGVSSGAGYAEAVPVHPVVVWSLVLCPPLIPWHCQPPSSH